MPQPHHWIHMYGRKGSFDFSLTLLILKVDNVRRLEWRDQNEVLWHVSAFHIKSDTLNVWEEVNTNVHVFACILVFRIDLEDCIQYDFFMNIFHINISLLFLFRFHYKSYVIILYKPHRQFKMKVNCRVCWSVKKYRIWKLQTPLDIWSTNVNSSFSCIALRLNSADGAEFLFWNKKNDKMLKY